MSKTPELSDARIAAYLSELTERWTLKPSVVYFRNGPFRPSKPFKRFRANLIAKRYSIKDYNLADNAHV